MSSIYGREEREETVIPRELLRERRGAGIFRRDFDVTDSERQTIVTMLRAGEPVRDVALAVQRSKPTIRRLAKREGIEVTRPSRSSRFRRPRTSLEIDPETRRRLLNVQHELGATSAGATIRRLLDMGGF